MVSLLQSMRFYESLRRDILTLLDTIGCDVIDIVLQLVDEHTANMILVRQTDLDQYVDEIVEIFATNELGKARYRYVYDYYVKVILGYPHLSQIIDDELDQDNIAKMIMEVFDLHSFMWSCGYIRSAEIRQAQRMICYNEINELLGTLVPIDLFSIVDAYMV